MSLTVSAIHMAELAVSRSSPGTTCGRAAERAGRKNDETAASTKTSPKTRPMFSPDATGMKPTIPARTRSEPTMTRFRSHRSTRAPASGPTRKLGIVIAAKARPSASGELSVALATRNTSATW